VVPGERIPVVLLQDGAPDDISAAMYLMLDENVNLAGIVITNGETHPSRALVKWRLIAPTWDGTAYRSLPVMIVVDPTPTSSPHLADGADNFWG
jgi:inosine-uridine nucleoside N-ribohydrolase